MSDERYDALLAELRGDDATPSDELRQRLAGRLSETVANGAAGLAAADLASEVLAEMGAEGAAATVGMVSTKVALWMTVAGVAVGGAGGALTYHAVVVGEGRNAPIVGPAIVGPADAAIAHDAGDGDAGLMPSDSGVDAGPLLDDRRVDGVRDDGADDDGVRVDGRARSDLPPTTEASRRQERVLLRQAQNALVRDRPEDALAALRRHAHLYPDSTFVEERDALEVQSLAAAGRTAEATRKAAAFEAAHPGSIFLPRVRAAAP